MNIRSLSHDERVVMRKLFWYESIKVGELPIAPGVIDELCELGLVRKFDGYVLLTPKGKRFQIVGNEPGDPPPPAERRYRQVRDNDSHRYLIPADRDHEWGEWLNIPSDDPASWEPPEFARRIDGGALTFTNPQIAGLPVVFPA